MFQGNAKWIILEPKVNIAVSIPFQFHCTMPGIQIKHDLFAPTGLRLHANCLGKPQVDCRVLKTLSLFSLCEREKMPHPCRGEWTQTFSVSAACTMGTKKHRVRSTTINPQEARKAKTFSACGIAELVFYHNAKQSKHAIYWWVQTRT